MHVRVFGAAGVCIGLVTGTPRDTPATAHAAHDNARPGEVASAGAPADTTAPRTTSALIDTVHVRRSRTRGDVLDARAGMSSVREIDDGALRVQSVADVLDEVVGVRVRRYGGLGALATASIRASDAGQVEVYLDGVPLNAAQFGLTNLSDVALDNLQRVEVYRSHAPAAFGTGGIGGVVNLVTRDAGPRHATLSLSAGSFGTRRARALLSGTVGAAEYLVSYGRLASEGDFEFLYDPGTEQHNTADDQLRTRENNDVVQHAVLAKLEAKLRGFELTLMDDWLLETSGNPGFGNRLYRDARDDTRRHALSGSLTTPFFLDRRTRATVTAFHGYQRNRYTNPGNESGLPRYAKTHRSRAGGLRAALDVDLAELRQRLALALERKRETFVPVDANPRIGEGFERSRHTTSAVVEDALAMAGGRVRVTGSYRYRESHDNYHGPLPFGGPPTERDEAHWATTHGPSVGLVVSPARGLMLKAARTHHERFPTLFEIFGTGGEVRPNPELVPETGATWDGGVVLHLGGHASRTARARLEVGAFRSDRDSLIVLIQDSATSFKPLNLSSARVVGVEVAFDVDLPIETLWLPILDRLRIEGAFTSQDARQRSDAPHYDDRWVPYASPRQLFVHTELSRRIARVPLSVRHEYRFFDRYYRDRANRPDRKVAPRRLHAFGARADLFSGRATLDLQIDNAFDVRVDDVYGYPTPGRAVTFTVSTELGR